MDAYASVATSFSISCNQQQHDADAVPGKRSACPSEAKIGAIRMLPTEHGCGNAGVPVAVLFFLAYSFVGTLRQARDRPWDLAFVAFAYADLAALFLCLRRAERLLPRDPSPSPAAESGERRRLQLAVWALSSALSCAFACRVSLIMPAALAIIVWGMTSSVVLVGFYLLVLSNGRGLHALEDNGDGDAAGDRKGLAKKIGNGVESV